MEKLRQRFLTDSISRLESLQAKIDNESLSAEIKRELFRALHTIKGTAQTFSLIPVAKTAHELENVLQSIRDGQSETESSLLREGLQLLTGLLRNDGQVSGESFFAKIGKIFPPTNSANTFVNLSEYLSAAEENQLSEHEKNRLLSALENGSRFFIVETLFHYTDFASELPKLREILNDAGEIIATFPGANTSEKIGFQFFFASRENFAEIIARLEGFDAKLIEKNQTDFSGDLNGILKQAEITAQKTAQRLDKKIDVEFNAEKIELTAKQLKLLSDALPHLVRNAVDHGIARKGKIKIEISQNSGGHISLKVSDDGRGIDPENVQLAALEKNLIAPNANLSETEILNLIFAHGFSTAESVSEISGRGVGLDAVKDLVENAGGEIRVQSVKDKGTTFEIYLRQE